MTVFDPLPLSYPSSAGVALFESESLPTPRPASPVHSAVVLRQDDIDLVADYVATYNDIVPRTEQNANVVADRLESLGAENAANWVRGLNRHQRRMLSRLFCRYKAYQRGWWRSLTGEWTRVETLKNDHLINCARVCLWGPRRGVQKTVDEGVMWISRHPKLVEEIVKRGLLLAVVPYHKRNYEGWDDDRREHAEHVATFSSADWKVR